MRIHVALLTLFLGGCLAGCVVVGEIEAKPEGRRDAGRSSGNNGDDLPDPPPDESGDEPAPPPPSDVDDAGAAPPPPATDSGGGAPPPPPAGGEDVSAPPPPTAYPSGPYGLGVGYVVPNVSFSGYREATGSWTTVRMQDFYDPTGARGITGVLVTASAAWCGPCKEEAKQLVDLYASTYKARGARFLTAMIEDAYRNPAKQSTVDSWIAFARTNFDIVADPEQRTLRSGASLPYNFVIDPRTMKVTKTWSGSDPYASNIPALDAVITKNASY